MVQKLGLVSELPSFLWLKDHGYKNVHTAYHKYPEAFVQLKQVRLRKSHTQNVADAEELAKNNGDLLPSPSSLEADGHGSIVVDMQRFPDAYTHLKQTKRVKSLPEKVVEAEELAKGNKDKVPSVGWLFAHNYTHIYTAMRKYPKAFAHLKQDVVKKGGRAKGVRNKVNLS